MAAKRSGCAVVVEGSHADKVAAIRRLVDLYRRQMPERLQRVAPPRAERAPADPRA